MWPRFRLARELAGDVFPVTETIILMKARQNGIGRKMGRAIIFSPDDCKRLYQVLPCLSNVSADQNRPLRSSAAPSAESALRKALALATDAAPKKSGRTAKRNSLRNQFTAAMSSAARFARI